MTLAHHVRKNGLLHFPKITALASAAILTVAGGANSRGAENRPAAYSVTGKMIFQPFDFETDGKPIAKPTRQLDFEVLVNQCSWRIRIVHVGNPYFQHFTHTYDATNFVSYPTLANGEIGAGAVNSVPIPPASTGDASPWLAFASGCYL